MLFIIAAPGPGRAADLTLAEKIDIAKVWAGHSVDFAIATTEKYQCVVYYDTTRRMVAAARTPGSTAWSYHVLPTTTGWDSHNYIECTFDDSGYIHISGNMHNAPSLIYFRSKHPWSIDTFTTPGMVGSGESSVTYPVFIKGRNDQLVFQYRNGGSGSGTTIWNSYNLATKKWTRLTSQGLLDGEGEVNAYQTSPVAGPDGFFHVVWMWRDTPVANTNHHLSHIRSRDLIAWETMSGTPLQIPVRQSTPGVVADPVGSGHGLINMDFGISWDRQNRPVITYHRYDNNDVSQIFNTRWENGSWHIYQTSSWNGFKWDLDRTGSLTHDIAATPVFIDERGELVQNYVYRTGEMRRWVLNETTLKPSSDGIYEPPEVMEELYLVESTFPEMQVNRKRDGEYYLRWETMPIYQDAARSDGTYPSSSALRLYRFSTPTTTLSTELSISSGALTLEKNRFRIVISRSTGSDRNSPFSFSVALFTLDGTCIRSGAAGSSGCCVLPISNLPKGVYIIQVLSDRPTGSLPEILLTEQVVFF
ncbi:MAG: BNR repeat-containing protein [Chitinispirillaceae bacterium]|nr:BNR repeat-containing protein [Chitinispirillaceae bacterium]